MKFSKSYFSAKNTFVLILISLFFNFIYFHFGLEPNGLSWDNLYKITGDSVDYIESSEKLIQGKDFTFHKTSDDKEFTSNFLAPNEYNKSVYYAFRSPGFAFIYIPLRLIFNQHYSLIAFLLLQVIINGLAKYILALIGYKLFKSKSIFCSVFILLNITPYFSQYNNLILTDSLGASFVIFAAFFFIKAIEYKDLDKKMYYHLFLSGLFLTIAIFLRPFLGVFLVFFSLYLFIYFFKSLKKFVFVSFFYLISFVIVDGSWIIRNYYKTSKFIPLAATLEFHDHKHKALPIINDISSHLGYSKFWWDKNSPTFWFIHKDDNRKITDVFYNHRKNQIDLSKIEVIKTKFHKSLDQSTEIKFRKTLEMETVKDLDLLISEFESKNKFEYHLKSRFTILGSFLNQPNIRVFHSKKYPINVFLVFLQSTTTLIITYLGFIGTFYIVIKNIFKTNNLTAYIFLPSIVLTLFFSFILMGNEHRELYTMYGFLLLGGIATIQQFLIKNKSKFLLVFIPIIILFCYFGMEKTLNEINW